MSDFVNIETIQRARQTLKTAGYYLLETAYPESDCAEIVQFIDGYGTGPDTETHYDGSELRIWKAQQKHPILRRFCRESDVFVSCLRQQDTNALTLLAIRNRALAGDDAALRAGRWHLDSMSSQLKIFLFLNGAGERNGPLEFIPGTHTLTFKATMALRGVFGTPLDFIGSRKRRYGS